MEKSGLEPCQISRSKHRLVEICLMPLSRPIGFYILPLVLTSPSSSFLSFCFLLFHRFVTNRTILTQKPKAQGTWLAFHGKNLVFFYAAP